MGGFIHRPIGGAFRIRKLEHELFDVIGKRVGAASGGGGGAIGGVHRV